jgi:hypothetical protein
MRKIIVGARVSMDGVMQAPSGPSEDLDKGFKFGGWARPYQALRLLGAVQLLRQVWVQNYLPTEHGVRWRTPEDGLSPSRRFICSPCDPEAHYAIKRTSSWVGYKVHLTEACEPETPNLITDVETPVAPASDWEATTLVHAALARRDLLPNEHLVDLGYVDADLLVVAIDILGEATGMLYATGYRDVDGIIIPTDATGATPGRATARPGPAAGRGISRRLAMFLHGQVALQPIRQLARPAERRTMTAVDLVGNNAQALLHHAPQPCRGEQAVLPADDGARGNRGPAIEWPGLITWRLRLSPSTAAQSFVREVRRHVVVEHRARRIVLELCGLPGGGLKHLGGRLARRRHHAGDEHDKTRIDALGHQWRNIASEGLSNDHRVRAAAYRLDDAVGVIAQVGLIVLDRKIGGYGEVAVSTQLVLDQVPIPADVPSTVDEGKRTHTSGPFGIGDMNTFSPNRRKRLNLASANHAASTASLGCRSAGGHAPPVGLKRPAMSRSAQSGHSWLREPMDGGRSVRRLFLHSGVVRTPSLQPAAEMTPDFATCRAARTCDTGRR